MGNTGAAIAGPGFFREALAGAFDGACPLIALEGVVTRDGGGRAYGVAIYGVDDRFWKFHGRSLAGPDAPDVFLGDPLAREIGASPGDAVVIRIEKPSAIPAESLHGRKEELGRAIRLTARRVLAAQDLGEFSLRPGQAAVRAAFVPLRRLQRDLEQPGRINTILSASEDSGALARTLHARFELSDLGIKLRPVENGAALSLESDSAMLNDALIDAARRAAAGAALSPVFTYLANTIRAGSREIPYSLVTATAWPALQPNQIALNEWAARDLGARAGDRITLEYYLWSDDGRLITGSAAFDLASVVPIRGLAADRDFAPDYPGLTDAGKLHDWDPPFPLDLQRIRPADEDYWKRYRTTPKAFISVERAQQLWQSRFGKLTSLRVRPASAEFPRRLSNA
ncbi:MAG: hypothetical protein ACRD96_09915, partial [Bryobacteraceae bacterium]